MSRRKPRPVVLDEPAAHAVAARTACAVGESSPSCSLRESSPSCAVRESPRRSRWHDGAGQSTVEMVAVLPLLATLALAVGHVLAAGLAHELAGQAAEAGAIAALRGGDAREAVRAALPEWAGDRVEVDVEGRRVRVRLRPLSVSEPLADRLATTVTADAGAASPPARARGGRGSHREADGRSAAEADHAVDAGAVRGEDGSR